ncbi:MAG: 3-dehydroquinate synthase [Kiritimatiellaeota bacterium]|nr:3-dehydroquinate synthase [Kiritimatiellota bacterium]
MQQIVNVVLGSRSYAIHLGAGLLPQLGVLMAQALRGRNVLLVTDSHVSQIFGETAATSLRGAGFAVSRAVVPAGESSKCGEQLFTLYDSAKQAGLDRAGIVVALGGGVVGDLAGYLAASWLRGIAFVQVPTTLLSMVDSSVGGKTGINLPSGKNVVGAFHQPSLVVADLDVFETLPPRETRAGMAEVVKYGAIRDAQLFQTLEKEAAIFSKPWKNLGAAERELFASVIARCCAIKAEVVAGDEREETGLRAILNFGHTLGHAIENASGYGKILHGEAVAVGMVAAARLSARLTGLPAADVARLEKLLAQLALPVRAPGLAWADLKSAMKLDKKSQGGVPRFVLLKQLGESITGCAVPEHILEEVAHGLGE